MKKDWRIKKIKINGEDVYKYKEVYLKEAYARYKKKYREEIKKGNTYAKMSRKEFDDLMNDKLNNSTNPKNKGKTTKSFAQQINEESKALKKKSFDKLKELADKYNVDINQNVDRWTLADKIADLVDLGAFGNQDVDDFLY